MCNHAQEEIKPSFEPEDMLSLYNAGEIDELLDRAKEIRPSIRGPRWKSMVTEFTLKKTEKLLTKESISSLELNTILKMEEYFNFAHNQKNPQIQDKKLELGYAYLIQFFSTIQTHSKENIIATKNWWVNHWSNSRKNPIYALKYAKFFDSYSPLSKFESLNIHTFFENQKNLDEFVLNMLRVTFKSGLAADICKDNWVWPHWWDLVKTILQPLKKKDYSLLDTILLKDFSLKCWESAKIKLIEGLHTLSVEDKYIALHFLSLDPTLAKADKVFLEIYYLLFNPTPSELYNKSLDSLLALSVDAPQREIMVGKFSKFDPLLGTVFSLKTIESFEVILRLTKHFPEYLDFYAHTCLDYLSGTKRFPNGNPTPDCLDLCKYFTKHTNNFFEKPVYKMISAKFAGQCSKTEL